MLTYAYDDRYDRWGEKVAGFPRKIGTPIKLFYTTLNFWKVCLVMYTIIKFVMNLMLDEIKILNSK